MDQYKYTIGDKVYVQRPMVLGQIDQLIDLLDGVSLPESRSVGAIKKALGEKFYRALAIVLIEEGKGPEGKDLDVMAKDLKWTIDHKTTFDVVDDFFGCNPVVSLLERMTGTMVKVATQMAIFRKVGFRSSSCSSPKETSQNETQSCGDTPSETSNPTPGSASGK